MLCPPRILVESSGLLNVANEPFTIQPADSNYAMRTKKSIPFKYEMPASKHVEPCK